MITSYPPEWRELAAITNKTKADYCKRWGYDFHADCSDVRDAHTKQPIHGFIKLDLFLHFLPKYDVVAWVDADALITNQEKPLSDFIHTHDDLVLPFDHNGHNATVIIARRQDWVFNFFWACNNSGRTMFMKHDWKEMEAMRYFAMTPPYSLLPTYLSAKKLCGLLPEEYLPHLPTRVSQHYAWEPGDWCLHLSALSLERRTHLAQKYARELQLL